jgi:protein-disulfide isomerase
MGRQFHITAFEEIKKNYIDTGKLRYVGSVASTRDNLIR